MILSKKLISLLLIFSFAFSLCACEKPVRVDFSELLLRMKKELDEYSFDITDALYSEGQWFLFINAKEENDILITAKEDENRYITQLGISVMNTESDASQDFVRFCESGGKALTGFDNIESFLEKVSFYKEDEIFSDNTYFAEEGRYGLSFFNAESGSTVLYEIKR